MTEIKVDGFLITNGDLVEFPWRHWPTSEEIASPPPDSVIYPERWRVPKAKRNRNGPEMKFKTVCRVKAVTYIHAAAFNNAQKKPVNPGDIDIEVQIFVRPSDIGNMPIDPYEIVETDQSDGWIFFSVINLTRFAFSITFPVLFSLLSFSIKCFVDPFPLQFSPLPDTIWNILRRHSTLSHTRRERPGSPGVTRMASRASTTPKSSARPQGTLKLNNFVVAHNVQQTIFSRTVIGTSKIDNLVRLTPLIPLPGNKLSTLDLFSGCGGLSMGLHASGLTNSRWAVEIDPYAAAAYRSNFPTASVYNEDVDVWFRDLQVIKKKNYNYLHHIIRCTLNLKKKNRSARVILHALSQVELA